MKEAANASLLQAGGKPRLARFCSRQSQKAYRRAKGGSSSSLKAQAEPFLGSTVKHTERRQPLLLFFSLPRPFRKGIIPPPTLGRKICWTPSTNLNVNLIHRHSQKDIWGRLDPVTEPLWSGEADSETSHQVQTSVSIFLTTLGFWTTWILHLVKNIPHTWYIVGT